MKSRNVCICMMVVSFLMGWTGLACSASTEVAKLTADDGLQYDHFGIAVSIDSEYVVVGAYNDNNDDNGTFNSGSAYIFNRDGNTWTEQVRLTASDGASNDWFGYSVSMDGEYVVAGARRDDSNAGSAYIFKRDGTDWTEEDKLTASDGANGDEFGYSVCINGGNTVAGAYLDDDNGIQSGSAYMFGGLVICPSADLTGDCFVDLEDFAVISEQWLTGTR